MWVALRAALLLMLATPTTGLRCTRRTVISAGASAAAMTPAVPRVFAEDEAPRVLTEEEMAARVARKQELLRRSVSPSDYVSATDVRSDINPDAAVALRGRSVGDNLKASLAKQDELKSRSKKQKRDDLCEMLGRGC